MNVDTFFLGAKFIPIAFTNRISSVYPCDTSYYPITNVTIVFGATAYDHDDGNTYILIFHESPYYGKKYLMD